MSNALKGIVTLATEKGYKKLFGRVIAGNDKSIGVLERAGFDKIREEEKEGRQYSIFEKDL